MSGGKCKHCSPAFLLAHGHREEEGWFRPADGVGGHEGDRCLLMPLAVTASLPPDETCCGVQLLVTKLLTG